MSRWYGPATNGFGSDTVTNAQTFLSEARTNWLGVIVLGTNALTVESVVPRVDVFRATHWLVVKFRR